MVQANDNLIQPKTCCQSKPHSMEYHQLVHQICCPDAGTIICTCNLSSNISDKPSSFKTNEFQDRTPSSKIEETTELSSEEYCYTEVASMRRGIEESKTNSPRDTPSKQKKRVKFAVDMPFQKLIDNDPKP